ncbi:MAG: electron transfer flavoprotein subunit beta/FixA family protein [Candidatus Riflebacteria bacterium]|nr:electron transfer flavoprotein subunit beta/FixA family protein [Candidatus Riflebacteria bacterium]
MKPLRIIVPIKQVPETGAVKMDEATGVMIRDGVEAIINPLDLYAIEAALRLRERHGGCVTTLTMGPPKAITALREAIAMGVDDAVLISDKFFAGADTWATSNVLASAIRKLGDYDLIICGERATDGDTGQVGPGIAAWLNLPVACYVGKVELIEESRSNSEMPRDSINRQKGSTDVNEVNRTCRVRRLVEDGAEILDVCLPGLITVVKEVADPRLPTLRGKQRAKSATIPVWGAADLGLSRENTGLEGSPTRVVTITRPKVSRICEKLIAGDPASVHTAAMHIFKHISADIGGLRHD